MIDASTLRLSNGNVVNGRCDDKGNFLTATHKFILQDNGTFIKARRCMKRVLPNLAFIMQRTNQIQYFRGFIASMEDRVVMVDSK